MNSRHAERPKARENPVSQFAPLYLRHFVTQSEAAAFTEFGRRLQPLPTTVERDYVESRRSLGADVSVDALPRDLLLRVDQIASFVRRTFNYDLLDQRPEISFLRYASGDFFDWHHDVGEQTASIRKVSFSIQLSEATDYDGGDLEFAAMKAPELARELGTLVVFPAFNMHRVHRVTRGTRFSLVGWFYGPKFR